MRFLPWPYDTLTPVHEVDELMSRTQRALAKAGIATLGQLKADAEYHCREGDIRGIGNAGWYDIYQLLGIEWPWRVPKGRGQK